MATLQLRELNCWTLRALHAEMDGNAGHKRTEKKRKKKKKKKKVKRNKLVEAVGHEVH